MRNKIDRNLKHKSKLKKHWRKNFKMILRNYHWHHQGEFLFINSISKDKNIVFFSSLSRSECTEQCLKRKRDQENEIRELRKIFNDKDERIQLLDNEIKVHKLEIILKVFESEKSF